MSPWRGWTPGIPLYTIFLRMAGVRTIEELKRISIADRLQHEMVDERLAILRDVIRNGAIS